MRLLLSLFLPWRGIRLRSFPNQSTLFPFDRPFPPSDFHRALKQRYITGLGKVYVRVYI